VSRFSDLASLKDEIREVLSRKRIDIDNFRYLLEELVKARKTLIELILAEAHDYAEALGINLIAAVFPYPLSKYLGQDPEILRKYLREIHVMLYHKCPGAACLNKEIYTLIHILSSIGFSADQALEMAKYLTGIDLDVDEVNILLGQGLKTYWIEKLIDQNARIYREKFVPIIWLDNETKGVARNIIRKYNYVDLFVPHNG